MFSRTLLLSALLVGSTGCGQLFFVEAEVEEVCKTLPEISIPGMPSGQQEMNLDTGTEYDFGEQLASLPKVDLEADLELRSLTIKPTRGVTDLVFVEKAEASVVEGTQDVPVVSYLRAAGATSIPSVELAPSVPKDLFPLLQNGTVKLNAKLAATFPAQDWAVEVKACFRLRARVNYASAL